MLYTNLIRISRVFIPAALAMASMLPAPAGAQDESENITLSANVSLVSDYRFRGYSFSDEDVALQGGLDLGTRAGFYVGTWASSIDTFAGSETEVDVYGGYGGQLGDLAYDVGMLMYVYPGSSGTSYFEGYASLSGALGSARWTAGTAYAFKQDNIGNGDNLYLYLDGALPLAETGFGLTAHAGYEDGSLADKKWDWALGVSYSFDKFSLGVAYTDTDLADRLADATVVVSLGAAF